MFKQTLLLTLTICAAALSSISQPAYAQLNEVKLTASDAVAGDNFGWFVSISDDYAVVGALLDDDNGAGAGSAYVFKRSGAGWAQESHLLASDGAIGDQFGRSVSISGDYVVVGARYNDHNGTDAGSAYVFKRADTSWAQESQLLASDGATGDFFGSSVSISGDYVVVGAFQDGDNGIYSGSAYVFKRADTSWVQEAKLLPSDGGAIDGFGISVSISGDYVVVGAWGDDDNGSKSGSVYVFKRAGSIWTQEAKLLPSDGATDDWFGSSVSISGDYAVVGAWGNDDNGSRSGSAYVFKRTDTSWAQEAKLLPSDGAIDYFFGFPVSISGDYAVLGASGDGSGSAYVFKRSGTSWVEELKLLASDGAAGDWFGFSVSIFGDYVAVGAFADDDNGADGSGSIYLYTGFAAVVGVKNEEVGLAAEFTLSQNYPNPFNPETVIEYSLPKAGEVSLIVYNLRGEEVAHLINDNMPAGNHRISWNATNVSSGIYFYRLQAGDFVQTRKMVLLK
ncbi:MAG: T9SS type A sorting domain-containing protein [Candidatus Marinimicrobia bacterium]|nr:T9SS type A sorting domain-containing protein [Candidatus Neomarinimicrobiota bacterium]